MMKKVPLLFILIALTAAVFSQEDFWVGLNADAASYSVEGLSFGGGLSLGYGSGSSIGIKAVWFFSTDEINTLEINAFVRFYLLGKEAYSGPFLQIMGGPTFYSREFPYIPSEFGMISGGLSFGWRFLLKGGWFIEPQVRGGYPYLFGAGVSAGLRW